MKNFGISPNRYNLESGEELKDIKLLDCTVRDGGYLNDWKFGREHLLNIVERLVSAGVDVIEVGFLDERRDYDENRSIFPDTASVDKTYHTIQAKDSMLVGMIDYGTCSLTNLSPCAECCLDGIRVIFKKHVMHEAMEFVSQVKALGYQVFAQLVSITSYNDEELLEFIQIANGIKPYAVSMVDTYGLLHSPHLLHYYQILNEHLDSEIAIGYHSHNNFQLGYSNSIAFLEQRPQRNLLVDGTVYGMGKGAGNAPLELLAMHLNNVYGKQYDINQMLEIIDVNIMHFFKEYQWGYSLKYFLAASNDIHPNYVTYLMDKRTLSVKSINDILGQIQGDAMLLYDKALIEGLYYQYQCNECNDEKDQSRLREQFSNKKILLIGPGKRCVSDRDRILTYIDNVHPVVIANNFIPFNYTVDYVFLSNSKRYVQLATALAHQDTARTKIIATSNITETTSPFHYVLDYSQLLDLEGPVIDNSLLMLLTLLQKMNVAEVLLAGYDGYSTSGEQNYFTEDMEYWFDSDTATELNQYVSKQIRLHFSDLNIRFLTRSHYEAGDCI